MKVVSSKDGGQVIKWPFSTRTLRIQSYVYTFLCIWLVSVLIPTTFIVRNKSAKITVISNDNKASAMASVLMVDPLYWDYGFCEF